MKRANRKLSLSRETLHLLRTDLSQIHGGATLAPGTCTSTFSLQSTDTRCTTCD